jgi:LmbE family N-acetylglucosaminyl deacetylase
VTTIVCFHAHPDDECIGTGGTMARAAAAGHRVVLVVATRGERGEPTPGVLAEDEPLWERRIAETYESARVLGVQRVEFLGYVDSGMMGEPSNGSPYSFWTASVEHAATRLAAILVEESADVLTIYDDHGGYGHPDHIQVHRVGVRAAELAGTPRVFQGTMNRDQIRRSIEIFRDDAETNDGDGTALDGTAVDEALADRAERIDDVENFGKPEAEITHAIDVSDLVGLKRAAMLAHRSQIADDSWFLMMEPESFGTAFGTEWYIEWGATRADGAPFATSLWDPE